MHGAAGVGVGSPSKRLRPMHERRAGATPSATLTCPVSADAPHRFSAICGRSQPPAQPTIRSHASLT